MCMAVTLCAVLAVSAQSADLPNPKTGGAKGGPIAVLFLSWMPLMEKTYGEELTERGFVYATANYLEPIAPEFLDRFNVYVFDDLPIAGDEDRAGRENLPFIMARIRANVEKGAGLLVYASPHDANFRLAWNEEMRPWGVQITPETVLDPTAAFSPWRGYLDNAYAWTENLDRKHPVMAGLGRVYYPTGELAGVGWYAAQHLVCEPGWAPLIKTSLNALLASSHPPLSQWYYETTKPAEYVLAATRPAGKGRLAVLGMPPEYTHRAGYSGHSGYETSMGAVGAIVLKRGDGQVASDTGEMLMRLYAWLAGESGAAGLGGYIQGDPVVKGTAREKPPAGPLQAHKALIGAHSAHSDGQGTVAEYAQAAREAGYSLLVFTEDFEKLTPPRWEALVADCAGNTTTDFICLPGYEIKDPDNNRFLHIAPARYPHPAWLTADGKRLINPYMANFQNSRHTIVAHRPNSCPLPPERLKHFQGISVYTYRGDKLVDNSLNVYVWQVQGASFPLPVVVHEVFGPAEVALAAKTGYQQYTSEDDSLEKAVRRFCRVGLQSPTNPMISGGPRIAPLAVEGTPDPNLIRQNKAERTFRLVVTVNSDIPLRSVTLYDGFTPVRRWLPNASEFRGSAEFAFSHQHTFWVLAEDTQGRSGLRSMFWISPARWPGYFRCTDRQNWLGHIAMYYTGAFLPFGGAYNALKMPIKGTDEGNGLFTNTPGTCMAAKLNLPFTGNDVALTEFVLDEKYVDKTFNDVGLAVYPSQASKVTDVYAGRVRWYSFTQSLPAEPWVALVEYDLMLKRPVEPLQPEGLFPAVDQVRGQKLCWSDGKGGFVNGSLDPKDRATLTPVPRGGLGGGIIPLDEGWAVLDGRIGRLLPGAPDYLPAGTRLAGRFLIAARSNQVGSYDKVSKSFEDAPEAWLQAMGFAGETPYRLTWTRGKLAELAFVAVVAPDNYGVAGEVTQTADIPYQVPLQIGGLNPRWPAGSWRAGGRIAFTGVFENTAWPRLNVAQAGKFYAGSLLTADNPHLVLGLGRWDAEAITVEAHNPTAQPIEATVSTPTEITGYKPFRQQVTVPPGTTVYVEG